MIGSGLGVLILVAYPLLQIPLVLYLARRFELRGDEPPPTPTVAALTDQGSASESMSERTHRPGRCPRCGTDNGPAFTFCRNCVSRL